MHDRAIDDLHPCPGAADPERVGRATGVVALPLLALLWAPFLTGAGLPGQEAPPYDLVLRNGRIVDGTGSPWYRADVAVRGDEIVRVAPSIDGEAVREVDVRGQIVAPGFVDIHTHARRGIFDVPTAENYVRQGVTTVMEGPDGSSPVPLGPFLDSLAALPPSVNVGSFIGQGSVRSEVMGSEDRGATPEELRRMRALVDQAMREGAFGLSTGLFYVPGTFTPTDEVVALARVAGRLGGIHTSHMRDEASGVVASVRETIRIGEEGGLPTQVTHHKVVGPGYWGASVETLRLVDEARARGVDVTVDQYPYTASATSIHSALLPSWVLEGGLEAAAERFADPATRARARSESARIIELERGGGDPANVSITSCSEHEGLDGLTLAEVTRRRGLEPTLENAAEVAIQLTEEGGCRGVFHAMSDEDLERIMRHPATMIASDGEVPVPGRGRPHPRSYGTFARVLGVYVREKGVLTLEEAVRKMSAYPAQRLGLLDRGLVRPGMKADLAVFDPAAVRDVATFQDPHRYAEGFSLVVVNGQVVLEEGGMTEARPGRVLYGPARVVAGTGGG